MAMVVNSADGQEIKRTVDKSVLAKLKINDLSNQDVVIDKQDIIKPKNFFEIQKDFKEFWKDKTPGKGSGWKPYKRWEAFWGARVDSNGNFPDPKMIINEVSKFQSKEKQPDQMLSTINWELIGPKTRPSGDNGQLRGGMGRINCVAFDPNNAAEVWAGAAFGGLWKSTNGGYGWKSMTSTSILSIGVSDIAVSHQDHNIVFAATGDADGSFGSYANYSVGVIKTTDGGETWNETGFKANMSNGLLIFRLLVHPENDSILICATNAGIFKSNDQGANWVAVFEGIYCRDIEFNYQNPDSVYMAIVYNDPAYYGVFALNIHDNGYRGIISLPYNEARRIDLAVAPEHPAYCYVLVVHAATLGFHSLFVSDDAGQNFYIRASIEGGLDYLNSNFNAELDEDPAQGHYDLAMAISPTNPFEVYIGGVNIWKSTDAGLNFENVGEWTGFYGIPYVHADHHALRYSPAGDLFSANDGGLNKTTNGGDSWTDLSNGLEVTQFYKIGIKTNENFELVGGSQDNGTNMMNSSGAWRNVLGGDGMYCNIDQYGSNVIASLYYGDFRHSINGGGTFKEFINVDDTKEIAAWVAPLWVNPKNSTIAYVGHQNVWYTNNRGKSWAKISDFLSYDPENTHPLSIIKVYEKDENYIYAAKPGAVWFTSDGGKNWTSVITGGMISDLVIHPDDPKHIWFTSSGYDPETKVYDYKIGSGLVNISEGLPNVPANTIIYQKNTPDKLFVGTDLGVFFRDATMSEWKQYGNGLPNVVISDIKLDYNNSKIVAATYGRGVWMTDIVNCPETVVVVNKTGSTDLCPGDSLILEVATEFKTYKWSSGATTRSIVVKEAGKYSVEVEDENNCGYVSEDIDVLVMSVPDVSIRSNNDLKLCKGDSIELEIYPKALFKDAEWSNGMTGRTIWVKTPGKYSCVAITKQNCEGYAAEVEVVEVDKPAKPSIDYTDGVLKSSAADSYQWWFNSKEIKNATSREYTPTENGKYFVEAFNAANCSEVSIEMDVVVVSVDEHSNLLVIYPNPSEGIFNIQYSSEFKAVQSIEVFDMLGNKVYSRNTTSSSRKDMIDLSKQPAGVYLLTLMIDGQKIEKKIVKY
jgi:photosystem II stability/assembly factor-like uncharacterized protein